MTKHPFGRASRGSSTWSAPRCTATPPSALIARPVGKHHSPFGAGSAPGGETPAKIHSHMLALPQIAPSEPEVRITVAPIVVLAVDHDSEPWTQSGEGSVLSCMRRRLGGKISDSKGKNSMSSSGSSLPPLTRILELGHLRLLGPARVLRAASALLATQVN